MRKKMIAGAAALAALVCGAAFSQTGTEWLGEAITGSLSCYTIVDEVDGQMIARTVCTNTSNLAVYVSDEVLQ